MLLEHTRLDAAIRPWAEGVDFYLVEHRQTERFKPYLATKIEFTAQEEGFAFAEPSFSLPKEKAQEIFDTLWRLGFRPTRHINEASRIEAVTAHLTDMRAIAFSKLNIPNPVKS